MLLRPPFNPGVLKTGTGCVKMKLANTITINGASVRESGPKLEVQHASWVDR